MTAPAEIAVLLRSGLSDRAVARRLSIDTRHVRPVRRELGLPKAKPGRASPSLADAFYARTRRTADGHLEWTGTTYQGHPRLKFNGRIQSANRVAFRLRTGRDPGGYARPACGHRLCVDPPHVEDTPGRRQLADTYAAIFGRTA